ncbi:MAG: tetratricopeptide repeat protein [Actinomycetia bacterium]|nr:tetratricopeptide repeat protein [Actinomycetes bacterium]
MNSFSRPGAVDLSGLASGASGEPGTPAAFGAYSFEATEQTFQTEVAEASMQHVVVLSLWSPRAPESVTLNETLSKLADSYQGRLVVARLDVDSNPQIAQALQVRGVPYVLGLVQGQPVPLFQGSADEATAKEYLDKLLELAESNGVTGTAQPRATAEEEPEEEPESDPRFAEADEAFGSGDLDGAIAAYENLVSQNPADIEAAERLAGVRLMQRTTGADLDATRELAANNPDDIEAQLLVADFDISGGHVDDAFDRLIDLVRRMAGDDRERIRLRLIDLFTIVGNEDPRVGRARRDLAAALF